MESRFFEPPGEKQIGSNHRGVRKIGGKITVFDWWGENSFGSNYREFRKAEGSRNRDSTVNLKKKAAFNCQTVFQLMFFDNCVCIVIEQDVLPDRWVLINIQLNSSLLMIFSGWSSCLKPLDQTYLVPKEKKTFHPHRIPITKNKNMYLEKGITEEKTSVPNWTIWGGISVSINQISMQTLDFFYCMSGM